MKTQKVLVVSVFLFSAAFLAAQMLGGPGFDGPEDLPGSLASPSPNATVTPVPCYAVFQYEDVYNEGKGNAARVVSVGVSPDNPEEPLQTYGEGEPIPLDRVDDGWVETAPDLIMKRGEDNFSVMLYGFYPSRRSYERSIGNITILGGVVTEVINFPVPYRLDAQGNMLCTAMEGSFNDDEAGMSPDGSANVIDFCMAVSPKADAFTIVYECWDAAGLTPDFPSLFG